MVRLAVMNDRKAWIELSREVEGLFGPMAEVIEFREGIAGCINNDSAYCVEDEKNEIAGFIALDREKNEIAWLAVGSKFRGRGYGDMLLKKAVEELQGNGDIFVQTFSPKDERGKSALALYEKYGFKYLKDAGLNPAGLDTVMMIKTGRPKGWINEN